MKDRSIWITAGIILAGTILGAILLRDGKPSAKTDQQPEASARQGAGRSGGGGEAAMKGPHGGRMVSTADFSLEITIFEDGVPPEFRVYAFENRKSIDPGTVKLQIRLDRLGAQPEIVNFRKEEGFLRGDRTIAEPHSFTVSVAAEHKGQAYKWTYEQVEGRVRIDDSKLKAAGIELRTAGPLKIRSILNLQGEIQFNQDRVAHVVPRLAGVVVKAAKNLGDQVAKGELLAVLESQALADLKSEHHAAQTRVEMARDTFAREKRLWEEKISAQQDYFASRQALVEAEIAHRNAEQKLLALGLAHEAVMRNDRPDGLTRFEIHAPIDGVITEKHLAAGEAVKEDASIFTIADLSTVWAEMTIYPKDLGTVKLGQKVMVRASALDAKAEGRVSYVGSLIGEQTRSAKARVTLPNPGRSWRPGLFVTVDLVQDETEVPVAVSVDAIQSYRDWKVVFGRFGEYFEARPVELGRTDGTSVEILGGFAPGTQYAAKNSFVLKADLGKGGASHDH